MSEALVSGGVIDTATAAAASTATTAPTATANPTATGTATAIPAPTAAAVTGVGGAAAAALLAGCATPGGEGVGRSGSSGFRSDPAVAQGLLPWKGQWSDAQAARFLMQAAFGPTQAGLAELRSIGPDAWLRQQMEMPRSQGHLDWMLEHGYGDVAHRASFNGADNTLWRTLVGSPDVLRQRVALALSEIFVVSMQGLMGPWRGLMAAHYMDILETHAFGQYRTLLETITLSPAMGLYLNMRGNQKGDPNTGRLPDENYAREILQLFSIGLVALEEDGTPVQRPFHRRPLETYTQSDVAGLARVFTGWNYDGFQRDRHDWVRKPMVLQANRHEPGEKQFLGHTVPAGTPGRQALQQALDVVAAHPNVGPFIGRQLIQRLVTSHPSPAYVRRVAQTFADNGQGVRGDLGAVVRAVLLDPEARELPDPAIAASAGRGQLREPMVRFLHWARSFEATSAESGAKAWRIGNTSNTANSLGQSPLRSPSVFNFFRPGYVPPNTALASRSWTAPEFQLAHESSVAAWVNFAQGFVANGVGDVKPQYRRELALAQDVPELVQHLSLLLTAGSLSDPTRRLIEQAVSSIDPRGGNAARNRVWAAVHLILCSPDFLVMV